MSFFGLTYLGPSRSPFYHSLRRQDLTDFTDEDIVVAFKKIDKKNTGTISIDDIRPLLAELFGGIPAEGDVGMLTKWADILKRGPQPAGQGAESGILLRLTIEDILKAAAVVRQKRQEVAELVAASTSTAFSTPAQAITSTPAQTTMAGITPSSSSSASSSSSSNFSASSSSSISSTYASSSLSSSSLSSSVSSSSSSSSSSSDPSAISTSHTHSLHSSLPLPAQEFKSWELYHTRMHKHQRTRWNPTDKYRMPVTTSQELGWYTQAAVERVDRKPNVSCPETLFAGEMVKSGIYF